MESTISSKKLQKFEPLKQYCGQYKTAAEYAEALQSWMNQVYHLQYLHLSFPYFLANLQSQASLLQNVGNSTSPTTSSPSGANGYTATPSHPTAQQEQQNQRRQELPRRGVQYFLPPIWKRGVAEIIDFFLLFIIKLAVTYAAVDAFDLLEDVDKYDFETLGTDFLTDYRLALNMTSEILLLELIHRIGTCVFEALCLHRGPGGIGGATPGKRIMGLRVVRCEWVAPTLENQALVYPASDLGLGRAVIRSVVKNVSLTFLFPICFTLFSFQHRRTIYDILAGSIVVEERRAHRRMPIGIINIDIQNNNNNNNNNYNNVNQNN